MCEMRSRSTHRKLPDKRQGMSCRPRMPVDVAKKEDRQNGNSALASKTRENARAGRSECRPNFLPLFLSPFRLLFMHLPILFDDSRSLGRRKLTPPRRQRNAQVVIFTPSFSLPCHVWSGRKNRSDQEKKKIRGKHMYKRKISRCWCVIAWLTRNGDALAEASRVE